MEPSGALRCIRSEMRWAIGIVTILIMILIATPTLAKGPSSATLTGQGIDEPIELLDYPDHDVEIRNLVMRLMKLSGIWSPLTLTRIDPPQHLGEPLVLTWVNMGPPERGEDERTIRQFIYLHADGGPVIHTPEGQTALQGWGGEVTGWFRAPAGIEDILRAFGVPTDSIQAPSTAPSLLAFVTAVAFLVFAATRLLNSRLRPVVPNQ